MAGDWIKMRTDLYRDPKVCIIADALLDSDGDLARHVSQVTGRDMSVTRNVTRNVTVGALVTLWGVTRHTGKRNGDDLFIAGATLSVLDDITDVPGFGEALQRVGWADEDESGVVLPNYYKTYNTEPDAEKKGKNAERQRRHREKRNALRNVTAPSQSNAREEESREEESNTTTPTPTSKSKLPEVLLGIPPEWQQGEIAELLCLWSNHYAKVTGQPHNSISMKAVVYEMQRKGWTPEMACEAVIYSLGKPHWKTVQHPIEHAPAARESQYKPLTK